jgi:3',5'-cyclic AMP phosphodiesterase CpdA
MTAIARFRAPVLAAVVVAALVVLGIGIVYPADLPPAEAFEPFVFIHAGDTELGSPDLKGTTERFALLAARANMIGPAFVLIAGDLLHDCDDEHLAAFEGVMKQFKMPVKVIRGNHDKGDFYKKHFGADQYVYTFRNCDFICLDSEEPLDPATSQWKWLEASLKDARALERTHVFAAIHHPFDANSKIADLLSKGGVEAVLCGHLHTTKEIPMKGFTVYVTPGTAKFRDGKGYAYRIFKVYKDRIEQELVPLEKEVRKSDL